jgi:hypothetical protein
MRRSVIGAEEIRRYRSLRKAGRKLSGELLKAIPKSVLVSTARELGMWEQGTLVADEGDIDVLSDRMIYDRRWNGRNLLEHLEADLAESTLPEDERRYFRAMKTGRFSLFKIQSTHPGSHGMLSDRLAEILTGDPGPPIALVDLGLSETGVPGMLLAARVLDAGGFSMTSGVSFPFTPDNEAAIMKYLREKEPGFGKKRLDMPEDYSLYFYRLHKRFGVKVAYRFEEERQHRWEDEQES